MAYEKKRISSCELLWPVWSCRKPPTSQAAKARSRERSYYQRRLVASEETALQEREVNLWNNSRFLLRQWWCYARNTMAPSGARCFQARWKRQLLPYENMMEEHEVKARALLRQHWERICRPRMKESLFKLSSIRPCKVEEKGAQILKLRR